MTTTRIDGKFYPLQESEWIDACKKLNYSEIKVLYYLRSIDPFGDRFKDFYTKGVAKTLELSIRAVQRALKKLTELELIDLEKATFNSRVRPKRTVVELSGNNVESSINDVESSINDVESSINPSPPTPPPGTPDRQCEPECEPGTPRSPHKARYVTPIKTFHTNPEGDDKKNNLTPNSTPEEQQHLDPSLWQTDEPDPNQETKDMGEDRGSGAIVKKCEEALDKTDKSLYKPKPRPRKKQDIYDWVPEGPWNINGKLDKNFVEAIAQTWVKEWGGEIYKRRGDVISYFCNNPAKLPVRWEQYHAEYLDRYKVAQTLMTSGNKIEPDYQKRLIDNHRAITNPLPEELKPVATEPLQSSVISHQSSVISDQESLDTDFWLEEDPGESDLLAITSESSAITEEVNEIASESSAITEEVNEIASESSAIAEEVNVIAEEVSAIESSLVTDLSSNEGDSSLVTESDISSLITDDCSLITENNAPEEAENPQAYQKYKQPDYLNDPEYQPSPEKQAFMKNAVEEFSKKHSMPPRDPNLREPPKTSIEEINQCLEDPILREEIMPRLRKNLDMYDWIPDEYGRPIKIIDYKF